MDFEQLLARYEKPIYNLIYSMIGDVEEAADITQEVFIAAYRGSKSFRKESSAFTWLYRIAVNHCKNKFRKSGRAIRKGMLSIDSYENWQSEAEPLFYSQENETPWDALDRIELRRHIKKAILSLPYKYRVLIVLRDIQGLTYQETADVAGISLGLTRTRLARARALLQKILEPYLSL